MIEGRERFGLALEAADAIGITGELVRKNLDRHFAFELRIPGAIHLPHAPAAQKSRNLVRPELCADGDAQGVPLRSIELWELYTSANIRSIDGSDFVG